MDEAEKARRRKLALQKLARVFKGDEPARVPASNAYGVLAERKILTTILRTTHQPEIASLVRDRLAVISLDSDSDSDDDAPASNPTVAANEATDRLEATKSAEVTAWLREIANGTRQVPTTLQSPEYWEELGAPAKDTANARRRAEYAARMKLRARCEPALAPGEEIVWPHLGDDYNDERLHLIREQLRETGFTQFPSFAVSVPSIDVPGAADDGDGDAPRESSYNLRERGSWRWEGSSVPHRLDDTKRRDLLKTLVDRMRRFGAWSPAAAFMYDATWQLIDAAFDVAGVLLDADPDAGEVTLEPSCFAWALRCADEDDDETDESKNQKPKTKSRRQLLAAAPRLPRVRGLEHQGGRAAAGQRVDPADGRDDGQRVHVRPPAAARFVLVGFQTPRPSHPRAARGGRRRDASVRCVAREADDREGWVGVRVGGADGALGGRVRPA